MLMYYAIFTRTHIPMFIFIYIYLYYSFRRVNKIDGKYRYDTRAPGRVRKLGCRKDANQYSCIKFSKIKFKEIRQYFCLIFKTNKTKYLSSKLSRMKTEIKLKHKGS